MDGNGINPALSAIRTCASIGVAEYVICSGARNSALIAAITSLEEVDIYNHPEERSASFFALGRAIKSQAPVAVVTTSGTATAELLPAVIEAHYQAIPLVLVTADRPVRFRGKGAPQAIVQHDIFGVYAENCIDRWKANCPLHINVPLEESAVDEVINIPFDCAVNRLESTSLSVDEDDTKLLQEFLNKGNDFTVIVGCLPLSWRQDVRDFLFRINVPVLAESTSGLREDFPAADIPSCPKRVLRIGGVPSSRIWRNLESREDTDVLSVAPNGLPGLAADSKVVTSPSWDALTFSGSTNVIESTNAAVDLLVEKYPLSEHGWIRRLSKIIPEESLVFLGNSQPVRQWDISATREQRRLRCFANRGVNGIDGSVSTFLGLSAQEGQSWALLGDLTTIYDLAGPWILDQLPFANRRIVVVNNRGGRIFRQVKALKGFSDKQMRLVENNHSLCFKGWADMWGMSYRRASSMEDLEELPDGLLLIELIPDMNQTDLFWEGLGYL